jgi:hypothetical protein
MFFQNGEKVSCDLRSAPTLLCVVHVFVIGWFSDASADHRAESDRM